MTNENTTGYGTDVAANITMQPNGEHTLASVEWHCEFWTTGRSDAVVCVDFVKQIDF